MSKKNASIVWGIAIIAAAVILVLKNVVNVPFPEINWWALFIVLPFAYSMIRSKFSFFELGGMIVGLVLMFSKQIRSLLHITTVWYVLAPALLVCLGLSLIFRKEPVVKKVEVMIDNDTETTLDEGNKNEE